MSRVGASLCRRTISALRTGWTVITRSAPTNQITRRSVYRVMPDLRDGFRTLRATPIVTAVAILSLALGIGANTAIFSLINALILRSLPVKDPAQLVQLMTADGRPSWSNPLWEQIRDRDRQLFAGAFAYSNPRFNL